MINAARDYHEEAWSHRKEVDFCLPYFRNLTDWELKFLISLRFEFPHISVRQREYLDMTVAKVRDAISARRASYDDDVEDDDYQPTRKQPEDMDALKERLRGQLKRPVHEPEVMQRKSKRKRLVDDEKEPAWAVEQKARLRARLKR